MSNNLKKNEVKKAIIVGATSGIGKGLAEMLIVNQYIVGLTGRRTPYVNIVVA